jgi:hypothetical protein
MQTHEKAAILHELATGRDALLEAVRGLPEDLAGVGPGPGRWSIVECVEHLAVSEDFLLAQITQAKHSGTPIVNPKREAAILARGANRTTPLISPVEGRPSGRIASLQKRWRAFWPRASGPSGWSKPTATICAACR